MKVIYDKSRQRLPIKCWATDANGDLAIEEKALAQAVNLSNHPAAVGWISLMPDAHTGMGMPIGGVVCLHDAVCPNMVGVDIGCGMISYKTPWTLDRVQPKLKDIMNQIRRDLPVGFARRDPVKKFPTHWASDIDDLIASYYYTNGLTPGVEPWYDGDKEFSRYVRSQAGTLGGGNHFCEIQVEEETGYVWIMIHSGSRNVGKVVCDYYNKLAMSLNESWHSDLPSSDLAFFPLDSDEGKSYLNAMNFALDFAFLNRKYMMEVVVGAFGRSDLLAPDGWFDEIINIHHNYATMENHLGKNVMVHRKGATLARDKTVGIIPGSMGTSSYIVKGLNNKDSFNSCSHGAGRTMSRSMAKKTIPMEDFKKVMDGIEYTPVDTNLDEAPQAYKDITQVMANQTDLVEIIHELRPLGVVKG